MAKNVITGTASPTIRDMSIEGLYQAYIDEDQTFAEDVWTFFGGKEAKGYTMQEWTKDWGMYLPTYDPTSVELAARERDIDMQKAVDLLDISNRAADKIFKTEAYSISKGLESDVSKARTIAGKSGLRSGSLESAVEDTIAATGNLVGDLGDRLVIQRDEDKDSYNAATVDAALDFDKSEHQAKKEFYDRTMAALTRLTDLGAFKARDCGAENLFTCPDGTCAQNESECPGALEYDPGIGDQPPGNASETACIQVCVPFAGATGAGGMSCYDQCMAMGPTGDGVSPQFFNFVSESEAKSDCAQQGLGPPVWNPDTGTLDCTSLEGDSYEDIWVNCNKHVTQLGQCYCEDDNGNKCYDCDC